MLNLQLYIYDSDNEKYNQIELFDDESITITQSLQDVKDIQKIFTDSLFLHPRLTIKYLNTITTITFLISMRKRG